MKQGDLFEDNEDDEDLTLWQAIRTDPMSFSWFFIGIIIFFWVLLK